MTKKRCYELKEPYLVDDRDMIYIVLDVGKEVTAKWVLFSQAKQI